MKIRQHNAYKTKNDKYCTKQQRNSSFLNLVAGFHWYNLRHILWEVENESGKWSCPSRASWKGDFLELGKKFSDETKVRTDISSKSSSWIEFSDAFWKSGHHS